METTTVTFAVKNLAPSQGTFLTPFWIGFHNGGFDSYDSDASLDQFPGTEALAEDGNTGPISEQFDVVGAGTVQATVPGPEGPIAPGQITTYTVELDGSLESNRYFSYASMIIPSNDAFVANDDPLAFPIFDQNGEFIGANFTLAGTDINDAGTEVNDELPENTAFFGQQTPDTGVDENGVVQQHPGFNPPGSGGILDDPQFANADFTAEGYEVAQIQVVEGAAFPVTVTVENLAPENGTYLTPVWVGFHDGGFDIYNQGESLNGFPGTEALVEDGNVEPISNRFSEVGAGSVQGAIASSEGPIAPGQTVSDQFLIESGAASNQFFSYASMIIPSNDAFIANGDPEAFSLFDEQGNFRPVEFVVLGSDVLDGGTEVNDEVPENTAFFGQQTPDTGVDENGVVELHPGFNPPGSGGILDDPEFANADFTAEGYEVARIVVTADNPIFPEAAPVTLSSSLSGDQEVPPTSSTASGFSTLSLNETAEALEYSLTVFGLDFGQILGTDPQTPDTADDVMAVHIHDGDRGANGPVALGLVDLGNEALDNQDADDFDITLNPDGSVTLTGVWEQSDAASSPLSNFVSDIRTAEPGSDVGLYWNIHTEAFPAGEIRGQLAAGPLTSELAFGSLENDQLEAGLNLNGTQELIFTGAGTDLVDTSTGLGLNRIYGGQGTDELLLGQQERAFGGAGDDILDAALGAGGNRLYGGQGADDLFAGTRDRLVGGEGDDRLFITTGGENVLTGGAGADAFWLANAEFPAAINTVTDFERGADVIGIGGLGADFSQVDLTPSDGDTLLAVQGQEIARLLGVQADTLTESDFVFA